MRAAVLQRVGHIDVVDVDEPRPRAGEVLVEMRSIGICGSDLHAFRGHHPFRRAPVVLGHEGAGRIVQECPGGRFRLGDRVAIMPVLSCWECARCEEGLAHLCEHKRVPGNDWTGLLCEYVAAPERVLFPLSDAVDYQEAAMMEPIAVAWHTVRMGGVAPGHSVAVLGAGAIGSLVASVSRFHQTSTLLVSDIRERSLRLVEKLTGARTVDASRVDVVEFGTTLTERRGFDVVVVASGHPTCMAEALALCRPRGTVVVLPMFAGPVEVDLNPVVLNETLVRGSTIYTPADFRSAACAVNTGTLDVRPLLADPLPLAETQAAFRELENGSDLVKVHVDPTR